MNFGRMIRVALITGAAALSAAFVTTVEPQTAQADGYRRGDGDRGQWRGRRGDGYGRGYYGRGGRGYYQRGGRYYQPRGGYYQRGGGPIIVQPGYLPPRPVYVYPPRRGYYR